MRRFRIVLSSVGAAVLLVVSAAAFTGRASAFSGSGAGTSGSPYSITNCDQLEEIQGNLSASYVLANTIDCSSTAMSPLGGTSTPFTGTFDGKGYAITYASIGSVSVDNGGIFGVTQNATITDVRVEHATIRGKDNVGALVGQTTYTTLSYIAVTDSSVTSNGSNVGGIVGVLGGSSLSTSFVKDSSVTAAGDKVGGAVGSLAGPSTASDSYTEAVTVDASSTVGGVIGDVGVGPIYVSQLYADTIFVSAGSDVVGHVTTGFGANVSSTVDVHGTGSTYQDTSAVSPFDTWDFDTVWYIRPGNYPGLRPHTMPIMLCSPVNVTNSSVNGSCQTYPALEGNPHWELRYGFDDDTDRTTLTSQNGASFNVTVSSLLPGTNYDIEFRWVDAIGTGPWGKVVGTTTGSSDSDGDNISNEVESKAPNSGDANNDGTPDYLQANVTSFKSAISGKYVSLATTCTDNFNTQLGLESATQKDAMYDYPAGLLGFVIRGCTAGATTPVNVYFYGSYNPADYTVRKGRAGVYTAVPAATLSSVTIGGQSALKLAYNVTDGGALDDDGIVDGNIVDPVGLAVAASASSGNANGGTLANTGMELLTLSGLAAMLLGAALYVRYRPVRNNDAQ